MGIIRMKRHCDKRFALFTVFRYYPKNRHLAEWRFLRFVRCSVIVTVNGPTWNVIRINLTSSRRIDEPPTVFPVPFRLYFTRYSIFCQFPSSKTSDISLPGKTPPAGFPAGGVLLSLPNHRGVKFGQAFNPGAGHHRGQPAGHVLHGPLYAVGAVRHQHSHNMPAH